MYPLREGNAKAVFADLVNAVALRASIATPGRGTSHTEVLGAAQGSLTPCLVAPAGIVRCNANRADIGTGGEEPEMKVEIILANVEAGKIALPTFQRGYVWKRRQVREFFDSLYRRHPVGSLPTWLTSGDDGPATELLLDGQQRVTSLYGVIKGRPPDFFSGDAKAFSGLHFHVVHERFEFLQPIKMKDDPLWFDVTRVMRAGVDGIARLMEKHLAGIDAADDRESDVQIMGRLLRLLGVTGVDLHVEQITDEKQTIDTVVNIFNRLNSAGTRLSRGDLALARIAVKWPDVREKMGGHIEEWGKHDFHFALDWLLRCMNAGNYPGTVTQPGGQVS